ncbi:hypothetical protein OIU83_22565 [Flavobacterium sp. LS1R49]|uniref:Class IIb bacteriocin, lactobin A/cerein 7B family n=1 Tax=Flavobacterium shii TaxID=2987687 RepID=A0A9X3C076_9FLAO|nr:hypothetical protein [Flavobacterium shii]MCV9930461.1 hypothetical protein [Flavobacterium shii]
MNLENLNLVELNAQEVQEVDGGFFGPWWVGAGRINIMGMYDFGGSGISA